MKRFLAIFFLVLYVFTTTELNQLLKIPIFVEHFIEHQKLDNTVSLADFLYMHYTGHDINDNDQDKDMQLPFKSHIDCESISFASLPINNEVITLKLIPVVTKNVAVYKCLDIQSSFLSSIWQPPEAC